MSYADIAADPRGGAAAVTGPNVTPPVLVYIDGGKWRGRKIETFDTGESEPAASRVAASREAFLVSGGTWRGTFCSLYRRDEDRWVDVQAAVFDALRSRNAPLTRRQRRDASINISEMEARPGGGFILAHTSGVSWIDERGRVEADRAWPAEVTPLARVHDLSLDDDRPLVWAVVQLERSRETGEPAGQGRSALVSVALDPGSVPRPHPLPADLSRAFSVTANGAELYLGFRRDRGEVGVIAAPGTADR
ncbi:MAG: hypothetical protein AAFX76_04085 [Planctomycetota bacterium]